MRVFLLTVLTLGLVMPKGHAQEIQTFDLGTLRPEGAVYDINIDQERVFVPDITNKQVLVLDRHQMKLLTTIKDIPTPHGVAIDPVQNDIYISTHRSGRVHKFNKELKEIPDWDAPFKSKVQTPVAVEVDDKQDVYIADWEGAQILKVNAKGEHILNFDVAEIQKKGRLYPHSITVKEQKVFVTDRGNGIVHVFNREGKYLSSWNKPVGNFDPFTARFITPEIIIVPTYNDGFFYVYDVEGRLIGTEKVLGREPGKFQHATSLVADKDGFIYVSELGNRVQKLDFKPFIKRYEEKLKSLAP
jgi:DNA-binding beta-propeller fold protein YncE